MFLDHTQRRKTVGRSPLDEWSARRRNLYLTTHDTHNRQISMPRWDSNPRSQQASGRESYRLCCVVVCDLETSRMGAPYIYDISRLRVNYVIRLRNWIYVCWPCFVYCVFAFHVYCYNYTNDCWVNTLRTQNWIELNYCSVLLFWLRNCYGRTNFFPPNWRVWRQILSSSQFS